MLYSIKITKIPIKWIDYYSFTRMLLYKSETAYFSNTSKK